MKSTAIALAAFAVGALGGVGLSGRNTVAIAPSPDVPSTSEAASAPAAVAPAGTNGLTVVVQDAPAAEVPAEWSAKAPASTPAATTAAQQPVTVPRKSSGVDETALRYFAQRGDTHRLQAEIARLKALYPDWEPPADPAAAPVQVDAQLDAMWQLYGKQKYAEVRKAISDRQAREPAWSPPQDLLDQLSVGEARDRLVNASNLKQYETVIRVAVETPSLLTCADVDSLWRVAEAFALTDRPDRARDAYLYVLQKCDDQAIRLATMQKALGLLSSDRLDALLATERTGADGAGEFAAIKTDLVRKRVAAGGKDPPAPVSAADVAALEAIAIKDGHASDELLLGWYYLRREDASKAQTWFAKTSESEASAEAAQGLALALIALNRPADAEDVLYRWHNSSDETRKVYLAATAGLLAIDPPVPIDPAVLQRIVPIVAAAQDPATAQQLGWYAHALGQETTAAQWFSTALQWNPDDEPSAYGLALTSNILGDKAGVARIKKSWASRSERIATVGKRGKQAIPPKQQVPGPKAEASPIAAEQGTLVSTLETSSIRTTTSAGNFSAPARRAGCSNTDLYAQVKGKAALDRGWCLMQLDRPVEAVAAFERALETGNDAVRRDAAYGQSLAYLRNDLVDEAAVAAAKAPQTQARSVELEESILSKRAAGFFAKKRYAETLLALDQRARIAPERLDLMAMRGYAYLGLSRLGDARQVFEALVNSGDREGLHGLAAIKASTARQE